MQIAGGFAMRISGGCGVRMSGGFATNTQSRKFWLIQSKLIMVIVQWIA